MNIMNGVHVADHSDDTKAHWRLSARGIVIDVIKRPTISSEIFFNQESIHTEKTELFLKILKHANVIAKKLDCAGKLETWLKEHRALVSAEIKKPRHSSRGSSRTKR